LMPTKNWDWGRRHSWACWRRGETSGCHENALMCLSVNSEECASRRSPPISRNIWGGGRRRSRPFGKRNEWDHSIDHSDASHQPTYLIATCLTSSDGKVTKYPYQGMRNNLGENS
jgi:hypothetical protein